MKRKDFPSAWRPFYLKTLAEAARIIKDQQILNPRNGTRITNLRVLDGGPAFANQDESRLNVTLDEQGRIVGVDGVY